MSWPVYVINMANNTNRMMHVTSQLNGLGIPFTRFEAVNGRALTPDQIDAIYDPVANLTRARHPMIGPELGCYMSHIKLWRTIADGPWNGGIILEDDFSCSSDFSDVLGALATDQSEWDLVKLFSARTNQKLKIEHLLCDGRELATPYKVPNTTLGYVIRRNAAKRLANNSLPFSRPVDEDHKHFWEQNLRVKMVTPPPLRFSDLSTEVGTITAARRVQTATSFTQKLEQLRRTVRFRINYLVKLHWHRLVKRAR